MDSPTFWSHLAGEVESGHAVFAAFVVHQTKGSPGTTAARLLLSASGKQLGTIGGGIMESQILEEGQNALATHTHPAPKLRHLEHKRSASPENASGLICGGRQTVLSTVFHPGNDPAFMKDVRAAIADGGHHAVHITPTASSVHPTPPTLTAPKLTETENSWQVHLPLHNHRRIAIFGGGHCGTALAELMHRLDYAVSVVEPRSDLPTLGSLPKNVCLISLAFEEGGPKIAFPSETHAIVMTYSMPTDVEALTGILPIPFTSVGLMGSTPKIRQIRNALLGKGFSSEQLDAIRAPIGLPFNSDTPDEIAVSIAAQMLLEREGTKGNSVA